MILSSLCWMKFEEALFLFSLKNVSFQDILSYPDIQIPQGKTTFICGESGCGKSTMLKLLNAVISPSSGVITYAGKDIATLDPITLRREVLLVGQNSYLLDLSIRENFHAFAAYRDMKPISDEMMTAYLSACSLTLSLDSSCTLLSGGERQRVFIAIHLSLQPKVLMMDEPTSALDDKNAQALMENITSYCKEKDMTLIVVSHDKGIAERYADHTISLGGHT